MNHIEKEKLIKADIASIENRVRHAFNQGYDLGFKDGKKRAKPIEQEPQTFKWCTTCKEYDQEKHCCHRWSKVIRDTIKEMEQEPRWIPVKFRSLTDEEQNEYPDYCYMADCLMPDDGEEILVCTVHGTVERDECGIEDGFYLDSGYDWQTDIVAWMPLPASFEPQESEEKG